MAAAPTISVIIPTWNRAESLREVLRNLARQEAGGRFTYEVIVVDNNSTDSTKRVVEAMRPIYPAPLTYLFEGRQGRSYALNRGLRRAHGELIAFTDDDVRMEPTWLAVLHRTFHEYGADGVGGPVRALWHGERPAWLSDRLAKQLGLVDHGSEPFVVTNECTIFIGPNNAYRRSLFIRLGGFDQARIGNSEDVEWFLRAFRSGNKLVYQPQAVVLNTIEASRWTPRSFSRRFFNQGRACALGLQEKGGYRGVCRVPLWVVRYWLTLHWEAAACWLRGERAEALWHWLRRYFYLGAMWYCFTDWIRRRPTRCPRPVIVPESIAGPLASSSRP